VLAEGEATGHAHRVRPSRGAKAHLLELGDRLFLRVLNGDATVVHEEHRPITLPPGEYEVGRVHVFDYDAFEGRVVSKDPNRYPKGWNRRKVEAVIRYYENQTDDEAIAEAEAAYKSSRFSMIAVPIELVPKVQQLISRQKRPA
jgi:hypothetical protein